MATPTHQAKHTHLQSLQFLYACSVEHPLILCLLLYLLLVLSPVSRNTKHLTVTLVWLLKILQIYGCYEESEPKIIFTSLAAKLHPAHTHTHNMITQLPNNYFQSVLYDHYIKSTACVV